MARINPKRLAPIGGFTAANGDSFTIEQDTKTKACVISNGRDKVLQTVPSETKAWGTVRYLAGITFRSQRSKYSPKTYVGMEGVYSAKRAAE